MYVVDMDMDTHIGQNVRRIRGDRSLRDVAAWMRLRGMKWSHMTLVSVEDGTRPLRLTEAVFLAELFNSEVGAFYELQDDPAPAARRALDQAIQAAEQARQVVLQAFVQMDVALTALAQLPDDHPQLAQERQRAQALVDDLSEDMAAFANELGNRAQR